MFESEIPPPDIVGGSVAASPRALTPREAEVVASVGRGLSNRDIARRLWLSETTVKFHLSRIYRKLELTTRDELILWEVRNRTT